MWRTKKMPDIEIKKGEALDLYTLPDFTAGEVVSVQNKSRFSSAFLTSDATSPTYDKVHDGVEIAYLGLAETQSGDLNAWVSAPDGDIILSAR